MIQIILNDEQANAVQRAAEAVELRDERGTLIGFVSRPPSETVVEIAKRRVNSDGPWLTSQQVLDHLQSLKQG